MSLLSDLVLCRRPAASFAQIGVFWGAFAAQVPPLKAQAGLSDSGFGLVMLVTAAGGVIAMSAAPWLDRKLGARALMVMSLILTCVVLLPGLAQGWVFFMLAMLLATMSVGSLDVLMNARVSQIEARVGHALMNLNHAMFSFAYAGGALLAGLLREAGTTPLPIFALVAGIVLALVPLTRGAEPVSQSGIPAANSASSPSADPASEFTTSPPMAPPMGLPWGIVLPIGMIVLIAFLSENATEAWSALHLERNMGAGAATGALGPAILGLTMGVGRLTGQIASQRLPEAQVIWWASVMTALGAALAGWAQSLALGYLGFGLLGLGVSVVAPLAFAWVGRMVRPDLRTLAISRVAAIGYSGFFIGPPVMGFLSDGFGLHISFSAIAALM
ncbi:MAG: MFS transporter, partial [Primorskyibacter sp.]